MRNSKKLGKTTGEISRKVRDLRGDRLHDIILYGSYARGDFDRESDMDIVVLADIDEQNGREFRRGIDRIAGDISLDNDITVTIMLYDKHLFAARLPISPFYRNVIHDGVQLYGNN